MPLYWGTTRIGNVSIGYNAGSGSNNPNVQYNPTMTKLTNKTSYTTCNCNITVKETGKYKCSWVNFAYAAGSSTTYATQLYVNNSAVGSVHNSPVYSNTTDFVATETNISLTAGQTIDVRGRTRSGSSYYTTAGMLVIERTDTGGGGGTGNSYQIEVCNDTVQQWADVIFNIDSSGNVTVTGSGRNGGGSSIPSSIVANKTSVNTSGTAETIKATWSGDSTGVEVSINFTTQTVQARGKNGSSYITLTTSNNNNKEPFVVSNG